MPYVRTCIHIRLFARSLNVRAHLSLLTALVSPLYPERDERCNVRKSRVLTGNRMHKENYPVAFLS